MTKVLLSARSGDGSRTAQRNAQQASLGGHLIKAVSKTQAVIAKSSGESELYGVIRSSTQALLVFRHLEDFGKAEVKVRVGMDANAAGGIVLRQELNSIRHAEAAFLWNQEQQTRRRFPF